MELNAVKTSRARHWAAEAKIIPPPRRSDLIEEELDGEVILFDPRDGNTHRLNQTALVVWRKCDGRRSAQQIAEQLTHTYDVGFDTALDHVEQLVARFGQLKLFDGTSES